MTAHCTSNILIFGLFMSIGHLQAAEPLRIARADGNTIAIRDYAPTGACKGTAVLSHGAGGSENGLAYLAGYLQKQGWHALVIGHQESGRSALRAKIPGLDVKAGLTALISDEKAYLARFADIQSALAWSRTRCQNPFTVLIGHSMGAATTMLAAGAKNRLGLDTRIAFDAYIAMSPQGVGRIFPNHAWSSITAPVYSLTGTEDRELDSDWRSRLTPYQSMPSGCKRLGIIEGANHMAFGRGGSSAQEALITASILDFLNDVKTKNCLHPFRAPGIVVESK